MLLSWKNTWKKSKFVEKIATATRKQIIQEEGTFGIIKNDRWYKRIVRRGIKSVLLEVFLVSIGHNLYKYHNKQKKVATAA